MLVYSSAVKCYKLWLQTGYMRFSLNTKQKLQCTSLSEFHLLHQYMFPLSLVWFFLITTLLLVYLGDIFFSQYPEADSQLSKKPSSPAPSIAACHLGSSPNDTLPSFVIQYSQMKWEDIFCVFVLVQTTDALTSQSQLASPLSRKTVMVTTLNDLAKAR